MSLGFRPPTMIAPCRQSVRVTAAKQASPSDKTVLPGSKLVFAQSAIASLVNPGALQTIHPGYFLATCLSGV